MSNKPVYCRIVRINPMQVADALREGRIYARGNDGEMFRTALKLSPMACRILSRSINEEGCSHYFLKTSR